MKVIIESRLAGDTRNNYRYALWCARAVWLGYGAHAIASHMLNPWFMDDSVSAERQSGIDNPWVWDPDVPHWFFTDLGISKCMILAIERCRRDNVPWEFRSLAEMSPECWSDYQRGLWPPHTEGFVIA